MVYCSTKGYIGVFVGARIYTIITEKLAITVCEKLLME